MNSSIGRSPRRGRRGDPAGVLGIGVAAALCSIGIGFSPQSATAADNAPGTRLRADRLPVAPLRAADGITALSGQVVDLQGRGLPRVELSVGASHAQTDDSGRFLVTYVIPGQTVMQIDGRKAGAKGDADYGYYEVRVEAPKGQTTVLPFKSWLPLIDHSHDVKLKSPSDGATSVTTPDIPGLELRIPAGTVIRDADGKVVTQIGITAIPRDRTPIPLPDQFDIPTFYTIQPGASCLYDARGGVGTATLAFPNTNHELPKARAALWRYEPDANGWTSYGYGSVSRDGKQIVPDPGVVLTDFDSGECDPDAHLRRPFTGRPDIKPKKDSK